MWDDPLVHRDTDLCDIDSIHKSNKQQYVTNHFSDFPKQIYQNEGCKIAKTDVKQCNIHVQTKMRNI